MKKLSLSIMLLLFTASAFAQSSAEKQIKALNRQLGSFLETNDVEGLKSIVHPKFMLQIPGGGFISRDSLLAGFTAGNNPYQTFDPNTQTVAFVNKLTAISMGEETIIHKTGVKKGEAFTRQFTNVWINEKGKWWLIQRTAFIFCTESYK